MQFNVFGKIVPVVFEKDYIKNHGWKGSFDSETFIITIDSSLHGQDKLQTILHELMHAIFYRVGLNQAQVSLDAHELIVENFATVLCENIKLIHKIK